MGIIHDLQEEHKVWVARNFPGNDDSQAFHGMVEEVGELAHTRLKFKQKIRGHADGDFTTALYQEQDALGDLFVFMMSYCNARGFDLELIIRDTWNEVKDRDWVLYPDTGRPADASGRPVG